MVDDTHDAQALSLAENDIRANMHPADQFEAFKRLIDSGLSAETVAAQFGVSPLVVTRRLKLANVAPEFLDLYRKAQIELEHLMALAVTDDQERQRKVWENLPPYRRTPDGLREALTEDEIPVHTAVVKFVGLKQYVKAGGGVRRDLFSDQQDDGHVVDSELWWKLPSLISVTSNWQRGSQAPTDRRGALASVTAVLGHYDAVTEGGSRRFGMTGYMAAIS